MIADRTIIIAGRVYRKNPEVNRYQMHIEGIGDRRMNHIPPHTYLEILGLPEPGGVSSMECYYLNHQTLHEVLWRAPGGAL